MIGTTWGRHRAVGSLLALALCGLSGCGSQEADGPLVEVGGEPIDAAQLRAYRAKLPEGLLPADGGEEGIRDLLKSLVDRHIMIMEGEALGYHRDSEFLARQQRLLSRRLKDMVLGDQIRSRVQVSEDEIQTLYVEGHWDREVFPAHILSATREDALEAIRLLDEGRVFEEVAAERSIAPDAAGGGILADYFGPHDAATVLVEAAHGLPVGEYTRTPVKTRDGYEVIKVLEVRPVSLELVRDKITRDIRMRKLVEEQRGFVAELEEKFGLEYRPEAVQALVRCGRTGVDLTEAELESTLATYAGDRVVTLADAAAALLGPRRPPPTDSAAVILAVRGRVLADSMLVLEARERGMAQTPDFARYRDHLHQRMMVTFLRKKAVLEKVEVAEDEIAGEYEANRENYRIPDAADVTELVVATREEAEELMAAVRDGEDMSVLARSRSLRREARATGGHIHVTEADSAMWGAALKEIWTASPRQLVGPTRVPEGFAVVRVDTVRVGQYWSYKEMRLRILHRRKLSKLHQTFEQYIAELRQRYADRVVWHDARIAALASQASD